MTTSRHSPERYDTQHSTASASTSILTPAGGSGGRLLGHSRFPGVFSKESKADGGAHYWATVGGAEIRVDDGAARARAQSMSDVRARGSRGREGGRGGESFSLLAPAHRRVLAQSIHIWSSFVYYSLNINIISIPYQPQQDPGPLTLVCDAIVVAF